MRSYMGKLVELHWDDAFDDGDTTVSKLNDQMGWITYGKVVRQNETLITVATSIGTGDSDQVQTTSVLLPMVTKVRVIE